MNLGGAGQGHNSIITMPNKKVLIFYCALDEGYIFLSYGGTWRSAIPTSPLGKQRQRRLAGAP